MSEEEQPAAPTEGNKKTFRTQRIYLKDASFEAPNSPELFTKKWEPKLSVEITNSATMLGEDIYDVVLSVTATVTVDDKTAFLGEVHQAGIFLLKGHEPEELQRLQQVFCLRTLYPYACATLSDMVSRGSFPQLLLPPMNFNALYAQKLKQAPQQDEDSVA